jgi:hypothetical protein
MNQLVIFTDPTTNLIITIVGILDDDLQSLVDSKPQNYKIISDPDVITKLLQTFNSNSETLNGMLQESSTYYLNGVVTTLPNIPHIKINKISMLNSCCSAACVSGFVSSAIGSSYFYGSSPIDQQNLLTAVSASMNPTNPADWSVLVWCSVPNDNASWTLKPHTANQVRVLNEDMLRYIETQRKHLSTLKTQIASVSEEPSQTNADVIHAIVWTS